jgi:FkbM family methyltransferase
LVPSLQRHEIDLVIDCGANFGQFALALRKEGYSGRIISLEPLLPVFQRLTTVSSKDPKWDVYNLGLGERKERRRLGVGKTSGFSSLLTPSQLLRGINRNSEIVSDVEIEITTLDAFLCELPNVPRNIFLKVDTQGYERFVLEGASESLVNIKGIQLEMSLVPLYEGEWVMEDFILYLRDRGFKLIDLKHVYSHPHTLELLQVDGLFWQAVNT